MNAKPTQTTITAIAFAVLISACNSSEPERKAATAPTESAGNAQPEQIETSTEPAAPKAERKSRVFVTNYDGETVSVIEGQPGFETATIPVEGSPHGMAIRKSEPRLLAVTESTGFGVTFIDPDTLEVKGRTDTNRGPQDAVFSKDGKLLYVISPLDFTLQTVDVATMKKVGEPLKFKKKPRRIILDPSGQSAFLLMVAPTEHGGSEAALLDLTKMTVERSVKIGINPQAMALGNNSRYLVTASFDESSLTVIDTNTFEVIATHPALTGMGLAVHPTKPIAYSSESFDDTIQILDLETGKQLAKLSPGQWPTYSATSADGKYVYVPHEESDSVVTIDTETNKVVGKSAVGKGPIEVEVYEP